jgi:hypothetical protein
LVPLCVAHFAARFGLVWVVVVVPFIAGAALAFVLSLPERPSTPEALPERTERTLPTTKLPRRRTPKDDSRNHELLLLLLLLLLLDGYIDSLRVENRPGLKARTSGA